MTIGAYGAALIASGGAVVGSLIATVPNAVLAHRRDRRDERTADRRASSELRLAARLVAQELEESATRLVRCAQKPECEGLNGQLPTSAWEQHRSTLAAAVDSPADWRRLTHAYSVVDDVNSELEDRRGLGAPEEFAAIVGHDGRDLFLEFMYAVGILELLVGDELIPFSAALEEADRLWPPIEFTKREPHS